VLRWRFERPATDHDDRTVARLAHPGRPGFRCTNSGRHLLFRCMADLKQLVSKDEMEIIGSTGADSTYLPPALALFHWTRTQWAGRCQRTFDPRLPTPAHQLWWSSTATITTCAHRSRAATRWRRIHRADDADSGSCHRRRRRPRSPSRSPASGRRPARCRSDGYDVVIKAAGTDERALRRPVSPDGPALVLGRTGTPGGADSDGLSPGDRCRPSGFAAARDWSAGAIEGVLEP